MSDRQITDMTLGSYRFTIVDSEQKYGSRILGRTFKMGGTYPDCVNVSIAYDSQGQPIRASIPHIMSDPECSKGAPLDRGGGSVLMLKALLRHVHERIPSITRFSFDDMSHIECGTEDEIRSRRHAKKGSYARPIPLNYFSIVFNGYTWYEKNFGAMYQSEEKHAEYRRRVKEFLTEEKMPPFVEFLQENPAVSMLLEREEMVKELEGLYEKSSTYKDLFTSIPKERRCPHARLWLIAFVTKKLRGIFSHEDWFIDVTRMDEPVAPLSGGRRRKGSGGGRRTRKRGDSFYVPRGFRREGGDWGHMIGVDSMEV